MDIMETRSRKKALAQRLRPFFDRKTFAIGEAFGPLPDRYIPRAFSTTAPGWGVFDQREGRFLRDKEVMALTDDQLMNEPKRHT